MPPTFANRKGRRCSSLLSCLALALPPPGPDCVASRNRIGASDDLLLLLLHRFVQDRVDLFRIYNAEELGADALAGVWAVPIS